jgi:hypothetical protein
VTVRRTAPEGHLTLYLLTWRIWWVLNNASIGHMGINSAFKELILVISLASMDHHQDSIYKNLKMLVHIVKKRTFLWHSFIFINSVCNYYQILDVLSVVRYAEILWCKYYECISKIFIDWQT